jgi:hypothetical protein
VKSRYKAVNRIIVNGLEAQDVDGVLASVPQVATTIDNCPACMALVNQVDPTLCPLHEKLVNADTSYQHELQIDPCDLDATTGPEAREAGDANRNYRAVTTVRTMV